MSVDSYKMKFTTKDGFEILADLDVNVYVYINPTKAVPVHACFLDEDSPPFTMVRPETTSTYQIVKAEKCHFRS